MKNLDTYLGNRDGYKFEYNSNIKPDINSGGCVITMTPSKKPKLVYRRKNIIIEDHHRSIL